MSKNSSVLGRYISVNGENQDIIPCSASETLDFVYYLAASYSHYNCTFIYMDKLKSNHVGVVSTGKDFGK